MAARQRIVKEQPSARAVLTQGMESAGQVMVPPMLYIPVEDYQQGAEDVTVDFRSLPDGRVALLAYTALDRLITGCGSQQPWVLMPTAKLDDIDQFMPYDVILLDVQLEEDQQRKAGA